MDAREICNSATPGKWDAGHGAGTVWAGSRVVADCSMDCAERWENANFIAAAREGWPAALDALQEARGLLRRYIVMRGADALCELDRQARAFLASLGEESGR